MLFENNISVCFNLTIRDYMQFHLAKNGASVHISLGSWFDESKIDLRVKQKFFFVKFSSFVNKSKKNWNVILPQ